MTEMTADGRRIQLALAVLEAADADGYARAVNVFVSKPRAGDYHLTTARTVPSGLIAKKLVIHLGEEKSIGYIVLREPVSCNWMSVPEEALKAKGWNFDVFDLMWLSAPFSVFELRDEAVESLLLSYGFLAPWIATPRMAFYARRRLSRLDEKWRCEFLDANEFDTERCEGCDECGDGSEAIHRIPRSESSS